MIYSHGPDQPPIQTKQKLKNQRLFPSSLPSPTNGRILETVLQKMRWILVIFVVNLPASVLYQFFLDLLFDLKPVQYEFQSAISPYPAPAKGIVGLDAAWSRLEHWNMIRRRISTSITSSCNYHEHWLNLYVCGWNRVCLLLRLHQFYLHFEGETLPHIVWIISSPAINTL